MQKTLTVVGDDSIRLASCVPTPGIDQVTLIAAASGGASPALGQARTDLQGRRAIG
jgi:hypothetical protein